MKAIKTLDEQLPPEARGEILPSVALATEKKFADIARKQKLTSDIQELEEDLALLRSESLQSKAAQRTTGRFKRKVR